MLGTLVAILLAGSGRPQLAVDLMLTHQPGTVFMSWEQGNPVTAPSVSTARRGEPVVRAVASSRVPTGRTRPSSGTRRTG